MAISIENQKKRITKVTILLIVVSFFLIFFVPTVFADDADTDFPHSMCETIFNGTTKTIQEILTGEGSYGSFYELMRGDGLGAEYGTVNATLCIIGGAWCLCIAMSHLFTNLDRGQDPMESVFKSLIELTISGVFLMYLGDIMKWIADLGEFIISTIALGGDADTALSADDMLLKLTGKSEGNMFWKILAIAELFLPWALSLVLQIIAKFVALQILIEIGIRRIFAPMAVADIYQEGLRSPGARYLKKYLAVFLKLSLCLLVCKFGATLTANIPAVAGEGPGSVITYLFDVIAINFTCIGIMFKTGEFANDIVGV